MIRPPSRSRLFPYTTLFRSVGQERKIYSPNSDRPLRYEMALAVNPGKYRYRIAAIDLAGNRSEEHTSELQSQSNLVCRLLLEKKKDLDQSRKQDSKKYIEDD